MRIKKIQFLLGLVVLLLASTNHGWGKEWQSETLNCAITFPEGWDEVTFPNPNIKAAARSPDESQVVMIVTDDKVYPGVKGVNMIFIFALEKTLYQGGKKIAGKKLKVGGLPGYETQGKMLANGKLISFLGHFVIAEGKVLQVHALDMKGDASQSSEMARALASFRFLRTPKGGASGFPQGQSDAFSIGYRVGRLSAVILPTAGLLVVLVFVILKLARRKSQRPPPLPPSQPPGF